MKYQVQVLSQGGNWDSPLFDQTTNFNINSWTVPNPLTDGWTYKWRVRANDNFEWGLWSDISTFTVDSNIPVAKAVTDRGAYNSTGTTRWSWAPSDDTGSGIMLYYVNITDDLGNIIADDDWTTELSYECSGLLDGRSYFCKLKAENGAGTVSNYGTSSDGILIDLDSPLAFAPRKTGDYNNTGTVNWMWTVSVDTGSGTKGYFVNITDDQNNVIADDEWTETNHFEKTGLLDDKTYYCTIKAENGAGTIGPYSDFSDGINIDLSVPIASQPMDSGEYNNTGVLMWHWEPSPDTGSGIVGYYVSIGTTPNGADILTDQFTSDTRFTLTSLVDGRSYYCKVKAVNGAGTFSEYSDCSDGILVDTIEPTAPVLSPTMEYDNTGTVAWCWTPANGTGSGVAHYEYCVGTCPGGEDRISNAISQECNITVGPLDSEGRYYAKARTVDMAGNAGPWTIDTTGILVDFTQPEIISTYPLDGIKDISPSMWITVQFSEDMDPLTLNDSNVTLETMSRGSVEFNASHFGSIAIIKPVDMLQEFTAYKLTFTQNIADLGGNPLKESLVTTFTTGGKVEISQGILYVKNVVPHNNSVNVPIDTTIIISFSSDLKTASLNGSVILKDGENTIPGKIEYSPDDRMAEFIPDNVLDYSTGYTLTVTTDIIDFEGTALDDKHIYHFETLAPPTDKPVLVSKSPQGTDVPVNSTVIVSFNRDMDRASVESSFSITPDIVGNYSWDNRTLIFTPSTPLQYETTYGVIIDSVASDEDGNHLDKSYPWYFTTASLSTGSDDDDSGDDSDDDSGSDDDDDGEGVSSDKKTFIKENAMWIIIAVIILVVIIVVAVLVLFRSKKPKKDLKTDERTTIDNGTGDTLSDEKRELLKAAQAMAPKITPQRKAPPEPSPKELENVLPGYTFTEKIGVGGFATVYRAIDKDGKNVAIKLPKFLDATVDASILKKFEEEANIWKKLKHSNIVKYYEGGTMPIPYLSIELMEGGNLMKVMAEHRFTLKESMDIMLQVVDAISYAHRMATVHRDLKPENILFTKDGTLKLSDWGIGKFMASESTTKTLGAKGTLCYSSPEQISKKKYGAVDWQTDIFQMGIVFYEVLTAVNPFIDEDPIGIIGKITNEDPDPPSSINPEIPPEMRLFNII